MEISAIARVLFLLTLANGAPVLARHILGNRLAAPLDGGTRFIDRRPLLGKSKTFRGIFVAVAVTSACAPIVGLGWKTGCQVGLAAMAGDLASSFVKRRLDVPSGGRATGLDQLPESLLPLLVCWNALSLTVLDATIICGLFMFGEMALSPLLYKFRLRERPY